MTFLGIDLGTQSVRVVALTEDGVQLASASSALDSHRDGVRHEQDPLRWREGVCDCLRSVAGELTPVRRSSIGGIAVDATSGTFTLLGPDNEVTAPGLMYDDGRAASYVDTVRAEGGSLWSELGYAPSPSWALSKLAMLALESPELLSGKGTRIAHQSDVVTSVLTGNPQVATDSSHAMKSGFDIRRLAWPDALMSRLGVPESALPQVVTPGSELGVLCARVAVETGLPHGTPVFAGMTDGCAAQLSSGALAPGDWNSVLGTTLVLKGVSTELRAEPTGTVYAHRGPEPGTWLPGGASGLGAGVVNQLFPDTELAGLTEAAKGVEPLVCYPLTGGGERFPFIAPEAHGFIADGLLDHTAIERFGAPRVFSSVLHGVAFTERRCFELLTESGFDTSGRLRIGGGGTRNEWWNQLRAEVLGRPLERTANTEAGAGMAILAAWAAGSESLAERASAMTTVARVYEPDGECHDEEYTAFREALSEQGWF